MLVGWALYSRWQSPKVLWYQDRMPKILLSRLASRLLGLHIIDEFLFVNFQYQILDVYIASNTKSLKKSSHQSALGSNSRQKIIIFVVLAYH